MDQRGRKRVLWILAEGSRIVHKRGSQLNRHTYTTKQIHIHQPSGNNYIHNDRWITIAIAVERLLSLIGLKWTLFFLRTIH